MVAIEKSAEACDDQREGTSKPMARRSNMKSGTARRGESVAENIMRRNELINPAKKMQGRRTPVEAGLNNKNRSGLGWDPSCDKNTRRGKFMQWARGSSIEQLKAVNFVVKSDLR